MSGRLDTVVYLRLPRRLYEKMRKLCMIKQMKISEYLRQLVRFSIPRKRVYILLRVESDDRKKLYTAVSELMYRYPELDYESWGGEIPPGEEL